MTNWFSVEVIGVILSAAGALGAFSTWVWKYAIIPCIALYKNIDNLTRSVDDIKKEVIPNGGSSIKDTVNRIDRRQVMIDKRSKAIFYNIQDAIVEVDKSIYAQNIHRFIHCMQVHHLEKLMITFFG